MRDRIYKHIDDERDFQDAKFGDSDDRRPESIWLTILTEEVGEVAQEVLKDDRVKLREELVQVAAVAVKWLEKLDKEWL